MDKVSVVQKIVTIPTYEPSEPCLHPMFLEKRVYQGSSGKVYPHPISESASDEKIDKKYTAIFLENEYLKVMILPELGGKIQRIYDKTNGYDAVYYNEVIKPALVGLAGPWASGGIEINWPQHRKPSSLEQIDYVINENDDGSVTVWCGEIENMYHTKGMAGYTLYPGKAYVELSGRLYNPTETPQTFLWWANPAVSVNDNTKTILPPDVNEVLDQNKRSASKFPVATGTYYNVDYSAGVDISEYKNIPVPTSYMVKKSEFDFIGNYDFGKNAGFIHIADHNISPGKKYWTWGSGDFGNAWIHNLTDNSGAYAELMAGVFTENQSDFSFIMPYEEKTFKQYFMPYKAVGEVKKASLDLIVNFEVKNGKAHMIIYAPAEIAINILVSGSSAVSYLKESAVVSPVRIYETEIDLDDDEIETSVRLVIKDKNGKELMRCMPTAKTGGKLSAAVRAVKQPKEIASLEELYLTAVHLEQYRHPTRRSEDYYLEGLRRDPFDIRLNNGYGRVLYRKGLFDEAEKRFRSAIERMTMLNPNPYDCEPYYNLGLALKMQRRYKEAYDAFYKSIWDGKMQDKGYYQLACVSAKMNDFDHALEFVDQALIRGSHNMRARTLKCALLRKKGRTEEAIAFARESIKIDPLDYGGRYELYVLTRDFKVINELTTLMHGNLQNYIDLSIAYAEANLISDASNILALIAEADKPVLHYYMAYYSNSDVELEIAQECEKDFAFPNRIQEIAVLNYAIEHNSDDWFSRYCLGNLYYDKGVWFKAVKCWKDALKIDSKNSFVLRNLAIATYNKLNDSSEALKLMDRAAMFAPEDARIFFELDRLRKLTNYPVKKRLKEMADKKELVESRDDFITEYVTLLNIEKYYKYALKIIKRHSFHPVEGTEGRIAIQYKKAHMGCAYECILDGDYEEAVKHLESALVYPENLHEGKLYGTMDNDIYYLLGCAYEKTDKIKSIEYFKKATEGKFSLAPAKYYSDPRPDMYFYRSLAYRKLGDEKKAIGGFNTLINYCEEHIDDKPEIDYFAAFLPDFLVFDGDLERDNYVHCCYLAALGYTGKGMKDKADEYIRRGLGKECSHQGLLSLKKLDQRAPETKKDENVLRAAKWNTKK